MIRDLGEIVQNMTQKDIVREAELDNIRVG